MSQKSGTGCGVSLGGPACHVLPNRASKGGLAWMRSHADDIVVGTKEFLGAHDAPLGDRCELTSRQVSHTDHQWGPWNSLGLTFLGFGAQADLTRAARSQPRGSDVGCAAPAELCSHAQRRRHSARPARLRAGPHHQKKGNVLKLVTKARLGEPSHFSVLASGGGGNSSGAVCLEFTLVSARACSGLLQGNQQTEALLRLLLRRGRVPAATTPRTSVCVAWPIEAVKPS